MLIRLHDYDHDYTITGLLFDLIVYSKYIKIRIRNEMD